MAGIGHKDVTMILSVVSTPSVASLAQGDNRYNKPFLVAWATAAARDGRPVFVKIFPTCR